MQSQYSLRATSVATTDGRPSLDPDSDNLIYSKVNHSAHLDNAAQDNDGAPPRPCARVLTLVLTIGTMLLFLVSIAGLAAGGLLEHSISGQTWNCAILADLAGVELALSCILLLAACVLCSCVCRSASRYHESSLAERGLKLCCSVCNIIVVYTFVAIGLVIVLLTASFANMGMQSQKIKTQDAIMDGIDGKIHIWRDKVTGVARIHAASKADAFFAQGLVQAEDRLWELEFTRLVVTGRLAEFVGNAGLKIDKQTRRLGMGKSALDMCQRASNTTKALFQRYADGVNHHMKTSTHRPIEFAFMGSEGSRIIPSVRLFSYHEPATFDYTLPCCAAKLIQFDMMGDSAKEAQKFSLWWRGAGDYSYSDISSIYDNYTNYSYPILNSEQLDISAADIEKAKRRDYTTTKLEDELYSSFFGPIRQKYAAKIKQNYKSTSSSSSSSSRDASAQASVDDERSSSSSTPDMTSSTEFDLFQFASKYASNGWSARGRDGVVSTASDPHLVITLPSVWYPIYLSWGGTESSPRVAATGVSLAGMPSLGIFRRDTFSATTGERISTLANAITSLQTDYADLWVPNLTADGKAFYVDDGKATLPVRETTEKIKVLFQDDEELTIKSSDIYGNDVSEVYFDKMKWGTANNAAPFPLFMYSTVFLPSIDATSADAFCATLDEDVVTAEEMRDRVAKKLYSPAFSIPIFDHNSTLVYAVSGRHMERWPGHTGRWPTLIRTSNSSGFYKQMSIPYDELPGAVFPAKASGDNWAMVATANQKVYPDGYSYDLGHNFAPGYRAARIQTELRKHVEDAGHTSVSREIQQNINSGMWVFGIQPSLMRNLNCFTKPAAGLTDSAQQDIWAAAEKSGWLSSKVGIAQGTWDGKADVGTRTIGFFWRTVQELSTLFSPVVKTLGAGARAPSSDDAYWHQLLVIEKALNGTAPAFVQTLCEGYLSRRGFAKGKNGIVAANNNSCVEAFVVAMLLTAQRFPSTDDARLNWGSTELKPFSSINRMMTGTPFSCMFDRTYPLPGDVTTTRVSDFSLTSKKFTSKVTSSMRQIYSSDRDRTMLFAFPGGVSGNPYSKHYDDLLQNFKKGEYFNVSLFGGK